MQIGWYKVLLCLRLLVGRRKASQSHDAYIVIKQHKAPWWVGAKGRHKVTPCNRALVIGVLAERGVRKGVRNIDIDKQLQARATGRERRVGRICFL